MTAPTAPSGEITDISQARAVLSWFAQTGGDGASLGDRFLAQLADMNLDPETLSDITVVMEACSTLRSAAMTALETLNRNHGAIEEAVAASRAPAEMDFYRQA